MEFQAQKRCKTENCPQTWVGQATARIIAGEKKCRQNWWENWIFAAAFGCSRWGPFKAHSNVPNL